jgi:CubicO group peptidase (beta-lactamase class C family)
MKKRALENTIKLTEAWLDYWFPRSGLPGLSVSVRDREGFDYSKTYGVANIEKDVPLTSNHLFRMASNTKMFTALAIGILHDRKELDFNDKIGKHLTWLASNEEMAKIKIDKILRHRSKIPSNGVMGGFWNFDLEFPGRKAFINQTIGLKPITAKTEGAKYSNWAYGILGEVISEVSGKSYEDFIKEEIIEPLGLENTFFVTGSKPSSANMASGYNDPVNGIYQEFNVLADMKAMNAAAGILSTPSDLSKFLLERERLLNTRTAVKLKQSDLDGCAAGLMGQDLGRYIVRGHGGSYPGHFSYNYINDSSGLAVSTATNLELASYCVDVIFKSAFFFKKNDTGNNRELEGRYDNIRGSFYAISAGEDIILLPMTDDDPWDEKEKLTRTGDGQFVISRPDVRHVGEPVNFVHENGRNIMNYAGLPFYKTT